MDNITHTFIGLAVAELAGQLFAKRGEPKEARARRWLVSGIANNAPDLDFVYTRITEGPLGYLLHHRGHTHTLLGALLLVLLPTALYLLWARKREKVSRDEVPLLLALAALGPLLHIFADGWNSYGVHPFWPWNNSWSYGDTIFIVEPWIWVFLAIPLAASARTRWGGVLCALPAGMALGLAWGSGYVGKPMACALTGVAAMIAAVSRIAPPKVRAALGPVTLLFVLVFFRVGSGSAETLVREALASQQYGTISDVTASPYPANPFCWSVDAREVSADQQNYRIVRATVASYPKIYSLFACGPRLRGEGGIAGWRPVTTPTAPQSSPVRFWDEAERSLVELRELSRTNCYVAAYLRFARLPLVVRKTERNIQLTDARFDRGDGPSFAFVSFPVRPDRCPEWIPPWEPPFSETARH